MPESGPPTPLTCAGCGLLCDDVTVLTSDDTVRLEPPCPLGSEWFSERILRPAGGPAATIDGQPADAEPALARAAELLRGARRPLLHGFEGATVEDARAAIALADRLGALVATDDLSEPWPGAAALPLRGASTATLGEIRDRARLVVIWREDPETTHPRLLERLGFGHHASQRILVVVDDRDTATAAHADQQLRWAPARDLEALITLQALQRCAAPPPSDLSAQLATLLELIRGVPHLAFVHGSGLTAGVGGERRALVLHDLVRFLCHERHAVTLALPRATGTTGVQDVLAWQTGYVGNVDLVSGHPELLTATQALVEHEGIDVALSIEGPPIPPIPPARLAAGVTQIALVSRPAGPDVAVSIRTAAAGVEASGTAHRLDGVPLALQAPRGGDAPTAAELLARLLVKVER